MSNENISLLALRQFSAAVERKPESNYLDFRQQKQQKHRHVHMLHFFVVHLERVEEENDEVQGIWFLIILCGKVLVDCFRHLFPDQIRIRHINPHGGCLNKLEQELKGLLVEAQ